MSINNVNTVYSANSGSIALINGEHPDYTHYPSPCSFEVTPGEEMDCIKDTTDEAPYLYIHSQ